MKNVTRAVAVSACVFFTQASSGNELATGAGPRSHYPSCSTPHVARYMAENRFACKNTPTGFVFWRPVTVFVDPDAPPGPK